jgi:hypothetical protein
LTKFLGPVEAQDGDGKTNKPAEPMYNLTFNGKSYALTKAEFEGSAFLKSAANELGKAMAGSSGGGAAAAHNIAKDVLLGAASGAASAFFKFGNKGDQIVESTAKYLAKKMTGKWAARIGTATVEKFLEVRLKGALSSGLDAAIKNAVKAATQKTTTKEFLEDVGKEMGCGALLAKFDAIIDEKVAVKVVEKLTLKFYNGMDKSLAIKLTGEVIKSVGDDAVKKAMQVVFDKAKGDEKDDELGDDTATELTLSSAMKTIEAELAKRVKTTAKKK